MTNLISMFRSFFVLAVSLAMSGSVVNAEDAITHSFLGCGKANRAVIVGEDGKVEWKFDKPASDGWVLANGNVLLALYPTADFPKGGVVEVERATKKIVFEYQGQQKEISTVLQLADDRFLVAELGDEPRAIVIDRSGKILENMPFKCQKGNAHMQTRMLRVLPNGNYIAPHLLDFAVKEYEPGTGKVVRSFPTDDRGRSIKEFPSERKKIDIGDYYSDSSKIMRVLGWEPKTKLEDGFKQTINFYRKYGKNYLNTSVQSKS